MLAELVSERAIRPRRLVRGDAVAVLSPSWGGPSAFPHVFDHGLRVLREWELEVREFPSARSAPEQLRRDPRMRADDVNTAFADPTVRAIFTSIGGDDSIRLLPFIERSVIEANPKIIIGFSDITTLLVALRRFGMVTFHGPSVMAGLSQMERLPARFRSHVREMLFQPATSYQYERYGAYADGYPDWSDKSKVGQTNQLQSDDGWHVVQGTGHVSGELFGGCLEVLDWLRGTDALPSPDDWEGRLLFLETSEEKPTAVYVARVLRSFGVMGVFDRISGLLVGRARNHSANEKAELERTIRRVVAAEFSRPDLPIVANLDFGHTDPQWVLPLGVDAEVNVDAQELRLVESWLS